MHGTELTISNSNDSIPSSPPSEVSVSFCGESFTRGTPIRLLTKVRTDSSFGICGAPNDAPHRQFTAAPLRYVRTNPRPPFTSSFPAATTNPSYQVPILQRCRLSSGGSTEISVYATVSVCSSMMRPLPFRAPTCLISLVSPVIFRSLSTFTVLVFNPSRA